MGESDAEGDEEGCKKSKIMKQRDRKKPSFTFRSGWVGRDRDRILRKET